MKLGTALVISALLIFALAGLWVGLVYKDLMEFKEKIQTEKNLFLLSNKSKVVAGFEFIFNASPNFLNSTELAEVENWKSKDLTKKYYKIIIFDTKIFEDLPNATQLNELAVFNSQNPVQAYTNISGIPASNFFIQDATEIRSVVFAKVIIILFEQNKLYLFYAVKEKKVVIYPETPLFITLKYIPKTILDFLAKKINA